MMKQMLLASFTHLTLCLKQKRCSVDGSNVHILSLIFFTNKHLKILYLSQNELEEIVSSHTCT